MTPEYSLPLIDSLIDWHIRHLPAHSPRSTYIEFEGIRTLLLSRRQGSLVAHDIGQSRRFVDNAKSASPRLWKRVFGEVRSAVN
jgi:hypothetical protein